MGETVLIIIKKERLIKNLTQEYVAKLLKISQSHYARIENGERELTFNHFIQLVKILEIEPQKIITIIYKNQMTFKSQDEIEWIKSYLDLLKK